MKIQHNWNQSQKNVLKILSKFQEILQDPVSKDWGEDFTPLYYGLNWFCILIHLTDYNKKIAYDHKKS